MRKVILAAALAATFCLSQTSHAQQSGGGAGTGAPVGGAVGGAATPQGQGASGGAALGGPPAAGSFSVQPQSQAAGDQAPGAATGAGQTFYGPADPGTAGTGTGTGTMTGTGGAGTGTGGTETGTEGGASSAGGAAGAGGGDVATRSPRANERTSVGSASNDPQVELARLRAEVDQLRAELDEMKGTRRSNKAQSADTGTGGSGSQQEQEQQPRPIASSTVEGRVSKVSKRSIEVIDSETGEPYVLRLNEDSRARSGQRRISVTRIRQGSEVRASFDLVAGDTYATQIDVVGKRRR